MKRLSSRKLAGAVAGMIAIVVIVLGSAQLGNVPEDLQRTGMLLVAALTGYQVFRQANQDEVD
ncbi:hypothetical protein LCGC14_0910070 [marine sediment metagenome]|uniref:Uncharacterized protein n=1 Tax=marine sediment metagenome TaxID=412755 RepID=A0A0F9PEM8_9ZZZZ